MKTEQPMYCMCPEGFCPGGSFYAQSIPSAKQNQANQIHCFLGQALVSWRGVAGPSPHPFPHLYVPSGLLCAVSVVHASVLVVHRCRVAPGFTLNSD